MENKTRTINTVEELKIFNNPYRMKIISIYKTHGVPLTAKQCADYMGEIPSKVHYHIKQLLSINILALDHVEVINGINAKYYYLPQEIFNINLLDKEMEEINQGSSEIESLVGVIINDFKQHFFDSKKNAIDTQSQKQSDYGLITATNLYLTEEEYNEITDIFESISKKHSSVDKKKKKYSFIGGLAKVKE